MILLVVLIVEIIETNDIVENDFVVFKFGHFLVATEHCFMETTDELFLGCFPEATASQVVDNPINIGQVVGTKLNRYVFFVGFILGDTQ